MFQKQVKTSMEQQGSIFFRQPRHSATVHRPCLHHRSVPFTRGDINKFVSRTTANSQDRDPFASRSNVDRVLNVHASDHQNESCDFFSMYRTFGMTRAEL